MTGDCGRLEGGQEAKNAGLWNSQELFSVQHASAITQSKPDRSGFVSFPLVSCGNLTLGDVCFLSAKGCKFRGLWGHSA